MSEKYILDLDLTNSSSLLWEKELQESKKQITQGKSIIFRLQLDPFHSSVSKGAELNLALQEAKKWIDHHFKEQAFGILGYHIDVGMLNQIRKEEFAHSQFEQIALVFSEYKLFIQYECAEEIILDNLGLIYTRPLSHFTPIFSIKLPFRGYLATKDSFEPSKNVASGFALLVSKELTISKELQSTFQSLCLKDQWIDCIESSDFSSHWEGIDTVLYDPNLMDENMHRQLLGFQAAGGKVVSDITAIPINQSS